MSEQSHVTERTRVSLSISSWYHVVVIVGVIVWGVLTIKVEIETTAQLARQAIDIGEQNAHNIHQMQMDEQKVRDDLQYFHQRYEDDMNRYIREPQKR